MASTPIPPSIWRQLGRYLEPRDIDVNDVLGDGKDGHVWGTSRGSALKIHVASGAYRNERDAYIRLRDLRVREVGGFAIPTLWYYDDCLAIEMSIVSPPRCVDFASARFDVPPDFLEDEGHMFEDFLRERFDDQAPDALAFWNELAARTGIYLDDLHRDNLRFE